MTASGADGPGLHRSCRLGVFLLQALHLSFEMAQPQLEALTFIQGLL